MINQTIPNKNIPVSTGNLHNPCIDYVWVGTKSKQDLYSHWIQNCGDNAAFLWFILVRGTFLELWWCVPQGIPPQKNAAGCCGKVEANSTFEEMQSDIVLRWPIILSWQSGGNVKKHGYYYRGNTTDISLHSVKFHFHLGSALCPRLKHSNDLPHPGCLLLLMGSRWFVHF